MFIEKNYLVYHRDYSISGLITGSTLANTKHYHIKFGKVAEVEKTGLNNHAKI